MSNPDYNLPQLTSTAMEALQRAFVECSHGPAEGLILAALVSIKQVHEALNSIGETIYEADPSEYCTAI